MGILIRGGGFLNKGADAIRVLTLPIRGFRRAFVRYPRRCLVRRKLRRILQAAPLYEDVHSDTLVIAPHPDDEALGVGGLMASTRAVGSKVTVLFLTRGEGNHRRCCGLPPETSARERRKLAIDACGMLGVDEADIRWEGLPCGSIPTIGEESFKTAVEAVSVVLRELQPGTVAFPHELDCWPDHVAAANICARAVAAALPHCRQVRYLVWAWYSLTLWGLRKLTAESARCVSFPAFVNAKQQAISHYMSSLAPCGRPFSGQLPRGFLSPFLSEQELVFVADGARG